MWDLIVSVPDHCLSFYFYQPEKMDIHRGRKSITVLLYDFMFDF